MYGNLGQIELWNNVVPNKGISFLYVKPRWSNVVSAIIDCRGTAMMFGCVCDSDCHFKVLKDKNLKYLQTTAWKARGLEWEGEK